MPPGVLHTSAPQQPLAETQPLPTRRSTFDPEPATPARPRFRPEPVEPTHTPSKALWAALALGALVVLLLGWHFLGGSNKSASSATTGRSAPIVNSGAVDRPTTAPVQNVSPEAPVSAPPVAALASTPAAEASTTAGGSGWYVVAFTYNHEGQAAEKARRLRRTHDSLHPEVFTPTGHGPYFVALGGPYANQDEAEAVYRHARRAGLPRDTFVRHY